MTTVEITDIIFALITGLTAGIIAWRILVFLDKPRLYGYETYWLIVIIPVAWIATVVVGFWLGGLISFAPQFAKFAIIGATNAAVDFGILNLLVGWTGIAKGKYFAVFKATSFSFAVVHSFFWNKYWAFQFTENGFSGAEFVQFILVYLVGMIINVGVASFVVNRIEPQFGLSARMWANVSAVAGSIAALVVSFVGLRFFVFV